MAAKLPGFLRELHQCLDGEGLQDNAIAAHDIIGDIGHCCLVDVTDREIGEMVRNSMHEKCTMNMNLFNNH